MSDEDHRFVNLGLDLDVDGCDRSHTLSRLSICTADPSSGEKPSMECSDGGGDDEAGEDVSDEGGKGTTVGNCRGVFPGPGLLFQADHYSSLPATPTGTPRLLMDHFCYYASDSDAPRRGHRRARRGGGGEGSEVSSPKDPTWLKRANIFSGRTEGVEGYEDDGDGVGGDGGGGGEELKPSTMIARPKGGRRPLWMDLEEVKACKDLGFELEMPATPSSSRMPIPGSAASPSCAAGCVDTSSTDSASSPIASWRISSPGDDPRDVKARLKVWAQAVALASASSSSSLQSI